MARGIINLNWTLSPEQSRYTRKKDGKRCVRTCTKVYTISLHDKTIQYKYKHRGAYRPLSGSQAARACESPNLRAVSPNHAKSRHADRRSVYLLSGPHGTERRVRKARGFRETWRHGKNADLPLLTPSLLGVAAAEFADNKPISAFILSRATVT